MYYDKLKKRKQMGGSQDTVIVENDGKTTLIDSHGRRYERKYETMKEAINAHGHGAVVIVDDIGEV